MIRVMLLRHATVLVELAGATLLVDPLLDPRGAQPAVEDTANPAPNPLVDLPEPADAVVARADAVVLTHLHVDHLDGTATELLSGHPVPVFCQPADAPRLRQLGIGAPLVPVESSERWGVVELVRTSGRHGTGRLAELLAPVSGFVLRAGDDAVYVAGDTVWCDAVRDAIAEHVPSVAIVNAGEARMLHGEPITMGAADVIEVARATPGEVVAVHMEAYNHCGLSRSALAAAAERAGVAICVPADGEALSFAKAAGALIDRSIIWRAR